MLGMGNKNICKSTHEFLLQFWIFFSKFEKILNLQQWSFYWYRKWKSKQLNLCLKHTEYSLWFFLDYLIVIMFFICQWSLLVEWNTLYVFTISTVGWSAREDVCWLLLIRLFCWIRWDYYECNKITIVISSGIHNRLSYLWNQDRCLAIFLWELLTVELCSTFHVNVYS